MANTYTQLHIQIIFAVQGRERLILPKHKDELQKFITGIVQRRNNKLLAINCMPDHTHLVIGLHPESAIASLVRDVKAGSSSFISDKRWLRGRFHWQEGYGAFSYSRWDLDKIITYVRTQEEHHRRQDFKKEYIKILKEFAIDYDERYLFQWVYTG